MNDLLIKALITVMIIDIIKDIKSKLKYIKKEE